MPGRLVALVMNIGDYENVRKLACQLDDGVAAKGYRDIAAMVKAGIDLANGLAADDKETLIGAASVVRDLPREELVSHILAHQIQSSRDLIWPACPRNRLPTQTCV